MSAKSLAGRKVKRAQFHVGFGDTARTGCHAEKDKAYMELTPIGVYVETSKKEEFIVPYSNVTWCNLMPEDLKP